jgi:hypothetical protein
MVEIWFLRVTFALALILMVVLGFVLMGGQP